MDFSITYRGITYEGDMDCREMDGCCGILLMHHLYIKGLTILERCENTRNAVAGLLGEQMRQFARNRGYGQILVSTVAEGCFNEIEELGDYETYSPAVGDDHYENFNFGTIARQCNWKAGTQTHNYNSGNEVITYSTKTTDLEEE